MPPEESNGVTCPPCRTPTLSPGVELPSGQRSGRPYPSIPLDPVYTYDASVLDRITQEVAGKVTREVERIHGSQTYGNYWNILTSFQLSYGGREWEVDAECDTVLHSSESRPGHVPVPCPPNEGMSRYSKCQLCGHFPCRWMFHITPPGGGDGRWIGDECVLNYAANPEHRPQLQQAINRYRSRVTERMANLRENTRRMILGHLWMATHSEWRRQGSGLASRLYWQVAKLTNRMTSGGAVVGREKHDYDMTVTGRLDDHPYVLQGLQLGASRRAAAAQAMMSSPRPPSAPSNPAPVTSATPSLLPPYDEVRRKIDTLLANQSRLDEWTRTFSSSVDQRLRSGHTLTERQLEWVNRSYQRLQNTMNIEARASSPP